MGHTISRIYPQIRALHNVTTVIHPQIWEHSPETVFILGNFPIFGGSFNINDCMESKLINSNRNLEFELSLAS